MRYLLSLLFITNLLSANYAHQTTNSGKIDMHGGKKQKLIDKPSNLSNKSFMLGNIGLQDSVKKNTKSQEDKQKTQK